MPILTLRTIITAPVEKCFDLSRSIDLHVQSMESSKEKAVDGKKSGFIHLNETVTWKANHFGISFTMTNRITEMQYPIKFVDQMTDGPFKKLHHQHLFRRIANQTEMTDIFEFEAPFGIIGSIAEIVFLKSYMIKLLTKRNQTIKSAAEQ